MEDILCGDCARQKNLSVDERVKIALSIKKGIKYQCTICLSEKFIPLGRTQSEPMSTELIRTARPTEAQETPKKESESSNNERIEQIELFDLL
jgi:hypothetical protein